MTRKTRSNVQANDTHNKKVINALSRIEKKLDGVPRMAKKLDKVMAEFQSQQDVHLKVREVAKMARRNPRTIHRLIRQGVLKAKRVAGGGRRGPFLIAREDAKALLVKLHRGRLPGYQMPRRLLFPPG